MDINTLTLAARYRLPLNTTTDGYAGANFERFDTDGGDDNGISLNAGIRSMVMPNIELGGEVSYYNLDDSDMGIKLSGKYYINHRWAVGASFEMIDDRDVMQATARYVF
ncbi:porin family protein [Alteromonas aestuariivivens]|nr:porin family protein [Alteromonas aestuariivivens]